MNAPPAKQPSVLLDAFTSVSSVASLIGSVFAGGYLVLSIGSGLYGGTAVLIFLVLLLQVAGLLLGAGVPALIQLIRRRFCLSRNTAILLAAAVAGVVGEIVGLVCIPVTGHC